MISLFFLSQPPFHQFSTHIHLLLEMIQGPLFIKHLHQTILLNIILSYFLSFYVFLLCIKIPYRIDFMYLHYRVHFIWFSIFLTFSFMTSLTSHLLIMISIQIPELSILSKPCKLCGASWAVSLLGYYYFSYSLFIRILVIIFIPV